MDGAGAQDSNTRRRDDGPFEETGRAAGDAAGDRLATKALDAVIPDGVADRRGARRRLARACGYALSAALLALALTVLVRTFLQIDYAELRTAIAATSGRRIAIALGCTAVSYLALTGYDALALRQLRLRVPYRITALASFTSYAVSFTLGFPIITAGTVRYWIYSTRGLSAGKVASLTVIAGLTFWLGMVLVLGLGFVLRAPGVSHLDHLDPALNRLIGVAVLGTLAAYLAWTAGGHRHATVQGFRLELPRFGVTAGQVCLGLIDLCAAAGTLFALLTPPRAIDYVTFLAVYVFGSLLGIASNVPGGIGVFEATMLKTVPAPSEAALFAALLMFRVIYYIVPFVLALALLGAHEAVRRWGAMREAMGGDDDPDGGTVG